MTVKGIKPEFLDVCRTALGSALRNIAVNPYMKIPL